MKKIILLVALCVCACCATAQTSGKKGYTVSGTIEEIPDGIKIYIGEMQGFFSFIPSDSAVVKGGKYTMNGYQKQPVSRIILASNGKDVRMAEFILENIPITINLAKDYKKNFISGGRDNELLAEYNKMEEEANATIEPIWQVSRDSTKTKAEREAADKKLEKFNIERQAVHVQYIIDHIPSGMSSVLLEYEYPDLDESTINRILAVMKDKCPQDEIYQAILADREKMKRTSIGAMYTDIAMKSPEGKLVKVSDFVSKNKVTMIDFWASWCGPCRAEMPNFIKIYNKYKDKGFAVVGVSLDDNAPAWTGAIKKLGIPWQQMSDLNGWQCSGVSLYNVTSIPATVLIGKDGKIIAKNLRGEELEAKLKEIFQ
jgi:thiol-disulfide isomerase/thioredoxin